MDVAGEEAEGFEDDGAAALSAFGPGLFCLGGMSLVSLVLSLVCR